MAFAYTIEREPPVTARRPRPIKPIVAALVVLLVVVGVFVAMDRHRSTHPTVADAHATVSDLQVISASDEPASNVRAALVSLAGTNHIASAPAAMSPEQQFVLGQLDRDQPPVSSPADVRVVLVMMGPDGQVWGAERLR